ncbi:hypothetical protein [Actinomadura napierensis]|uniref:hypothetical protein n=1 Tax=Actinomadura napierensis TaxID=267854 RepID=UPI0031DD0FC7
MDGKQHYADVQEVGGRLRYTDDDKANLARYADMVVGDRRLRLGEYRVYWFGGHELAGDEDAARAMLRSFFAPVARPTPHHCWGNTSA